MKGLYGFWVIAIRPITFERFTMPREYEPKLFNRAEFPTYQHYLEHIRSLNADPAEVCMSFCREHLDQVSKGKYIRVHNVEVYREFNLWILDYPKANYAPTVQYLSRFVRGMYGKSIQGWYSASYYPQLLVPEPLSQSLMKSYGLPFTSIELCLKCETPLDLKPSGEPYECLVCYIEDRKNRYRPHIKERNRANYLRRVEDGSNLDS